MKTGYLLVAEKHKYKYSGSIYERPKNLYILKIRKTFFIPSSGILIQDWRKEWELNKGG